MSAINLSGTLVQAGIGFEPSDFHASPYMLIQRDDGGLILVAGFTQDEMRDCSLRVYHGVNLSVSPESEES